MFFDLKKRTALVTGSSRGIGASIAEILGELGAAVVINYSKDKEGATLTAENVPIAQLDFGYEYVINETETRDLITKAQKVNTSNPYSWLQTGITYEQWFTDLNMSRVVSIGMDSAVITNFNTNDYVPGNDNNLFMMLIPLISILAIAGIIIVVVVFIKKRK